MNIRKVLCLLTMLACAAENCLAAEGDNLAASIYNHAHFRNREALARLKAAGRTDVEYRLAGGGDPTALRELAQRLGVKLMLETLSPSESSLITTADEAQDLLEQVASDAMTVMLDLVPPTIANEPLASYLDRFAGRLDYVHVCNSDGARSWGRESCRCRMCSTFCSGTALTAGIPSNC